MSVVNRPIKIILTKGDEVATLKVDPSWSIERLYEEIPEGFGPGDILELTHESIGPLERGKTVSYREEGLKKVQVKGRSMDELHGDWSQLKCYDDKEEKSEVQLIFKEGELYLKGTICKRRERNFSDLGLEGGETLEIPVGEKPYFTITYKGNEYYCPLKHDRKIWRSNLKDVIKDHEIDDGFTIFKQGQKLDGESTEEMGICDGDIIELINAPAKVSIHLMRGIVELYREELELEGLTLQGATKIIMDKYSFLRRAEKKNYIFKKEDGTILGSDLNIEFTALGVKSKDNLTFYDSAYKKEPVPFGPYDVHVKTTYGRCTTIEVYSQDTIINLQARIQDRLGICPEHQRFIYGNTMLEYGKTMEDYGITRDNKLLLVTRMRGGMFHKSSGRKDGFQSLEDGSCSKMHVTLENGTIVPINFDKWTSISSFVDILKKREKQISEAGVAAVNYKKWSNTEVCAWLKSIGMEKYLPIFKKYGIKGKMLPYINDKQKMKKIGIASYHIDAVMDEISQLISMSEYSNVSKFKAYE